MFDIHFAKQNIVRKFIDLEHNSRKVRRKRLGKAAKSIARDRLDFVGRWGMVEAPRHDRAGIEAH